MSFAPAGEKICLLEYAVRAFPAQFRMWTIPISNIPGLVHFYKRKKLVLPVYFVYINVQGRLYKRELDWGAQVDLSLAAQKALFSPRAIHFTYC